MTNIKMSDKMLEQICDGIDKDIVYLSGIINDLKRRRAEIKQEIEIISEQINETVKNVNKLKSDTHKIETRLDF